MTKYQWKQVIKEQCIEADVYESSCDRVLDLLANIMSIHQDFSKAYDEAEGNGDIDAMNVCSIRLESLSKTALQYWRELGLTPKEYREFMRSRAEGKKLNKVQSFIANFDNVQKE